MKHATVVKSEQKLEKDGRFGMRHVAPLAEPACQKQGPERATASPEKCGTAGNDAKQLLSDDLVEFLTKCDWGGFAG